MEENNLLEKLCREAETVEVPPELEPEQILARLENEKASGNKKINGADTSKKHRFHWHGYGSRVAAAAIVLMVSLGVYGVANSSAVKPAKEEIQTADMAGENHADVTEGFEMQTDQMAEGQETETAAGDAEQVKTLGDYRMADSYEDVREMLNQLIAARDSHDDLYLMTDGVAAGEDTVKAEAAEEESVSSTSDLATNAEKQQLSASTDHSTTNLQVTGVDESDIVKTDGQYIYIASNDQVKIVDVSTGNMRQIGSIKPELSGNMDRIREMFVSDNRMILILQTEDTDGLSVADPNFSAEKQMMLDLAYGPGRSDLVHTQVLTYDISSPAGAKLIGTFTQDGTYHTSRKIGDQLYLFTDYGYPVYDMFYRDGRTDEQQNKEDEETISKDDVKQALPKIQGQVIPENCIYLPKDPAEWGVLITSVDVKDPETAADQKLIFCGYSTLYVTKDTILLYCTDYDIASSRERTKLTKFAIGDGSVRAVCAEAVPGYVQDTFAIHENKDGFLYILTTAYMANGSTNQLYVLDDRLKIHGKIEHIADGETVYAARFVDEIGYFVTYRNMDPLFTVDFSDPAEPKLIGELEIPGFSDYLQFWDDTHLIGVGDERKAEDSEFVGIKVSLYDISDPTNVKESSKYVLEDSYYAPAKHDYKALLADSRKNVISFLTCDNRDENPISQQIFYVENGALKKAVSDQIKCSDVYESGADCYMTVENFRNLYIGDRLYLADQDFVISYDMEDQFQRSEICKLK